MRWLALIIMLFAAPALAVQPDEILDDPAQESRAREISKELRCLVCRNESIDDSHASLARDLRLLVRERIVAGDNDDEVIEYVVARYGEFVLLRPPFNAGNLAIWLAGPVLLILGGFTAWRFMSGSAKPAAAPTGLTEEEARRVDELTRD
ncbi:MAG: cytochrome c-type biogenesis protein [Pseudomonadota bacterium]